MEKELIGIATRSKSRAFIIEQRLSSSGILCFLSEVHIVNDSVVIAYKIKVQPKDVERAVEILLEVRTELGNDNFNLDDVVQEVDKILVPIDFSETSERVFGFALQIAAQLNAEMMLFHVFTFPIVTSIVQPNTIAYNLNIDFTINDLRNLQEDKMLKFKQKMMQKYIENMYSSIKIQHKVIEGDSADEILEMSRIYKPGAIILGMHGADESFQKLLGSVTEKVIEQAKVPVLAIPEKFEYKEFDQIEVLYATNFENSDFKAIRKLLTLLYPFKLKLQCVHFCKNEINSEIKLKVENFQTYFTVNYPQFEVLCDAIVANQPQKGIFDYIVQKKIDIVSLTTHKRSIFESIYNPSITKKIVQKIEIPLLVFHA